jgi:hypothetical protein
VEQWPCIERVQGSETASMPRPLRSISRESMPGTMNPTDRYDALSTIAQVAAAAFTRMHL